MLFTLYTLISYTPCVRFCLHYVSKSLTTNDFVIFSRVLKRSFNIITIHANYKIYRLKLHERNIINKKKNNTARNIITNMLYNNSK